MDLYEYVTKTFFYDQETGKFTNRVRRSRSCKIGDIAGHVSKKDGYIRIAFHGTAYLAHRLAWLYVHREMPPAQIDHINGNRSDNRIANLRLAKAGENSFNKLIAKNNTSGFKGVSYAKRHRQWTARIQVGKKSRFLGLFRTPEEAHQAYVEAALMLHGSFANDGQHAHPHQSGAQPHGLSKAAQSPPPQPSSQPPL